MGLFACNRDNFHMDQTFITWKIPEFEGNGALLDLGYCKLNEGV